MGLSFSFVNTGWFGALKQRETADKQGVSISIAKLVYIGLEVPKKFEVRVIF